MGFLWRGAALKTTGSLLLLAAAGGAQQTDQAPLKGLSLAELADIEITSVSKGPVKASRTAAAIYVITQDDIRRSGATSIPEALRLAPGVEVARIDSVKWAIGIRGFQTRLSRAVLVLFDGRSVYSPLFHGVYWEVQDTLMEDIDRIEVIRGPGGTIWGANAVDGVINVITRDSRDTQGALVSAGGGNVDQGSLDVRQGFGDGGPLNYRVYAKGITMGPQFHADNRQFDDWRRGQAGFRADWSATSRDTVTVQGDIYREAAGESTRITSVSPPAANIVNENAQLSGGNVTARWKHDLAGGADIQIQAYYDRVNRRQSSIAEYRDTFDIDFVHHLTLGDRHSVVWGLGARASLGDLPAVVPTLVFNPSRRTDQVYSAFAQDEIRLAGERLWLTVGSKLLHSSFSGFDAEPTVRLLWTPTARQTVWTAVTRAVRTPSDIEDTLVTTAIISANPPQFLRTTGNGIFTSETLVGYEAGYRHLLTRNLSLDIAGFFNEYDHLLSVEPGAPFTETLPAPPHTIVPITGGNGIRGTTSGFEVSADWKPASRWRLQGSYSYLRMDLRTKPGSRDTSTVASTEGSTPRHEPAIRSFFDLTRNIDISLAWRYVSALRAQNVADYQTADVRLAWRLRRSVEFSISGQNLLQPRHAEFGGNPLGLVGIKRDVYAAVTFRQK
jgi:iron complex outermembrane receptor protein